MDQTSSQRSRTAGTTRPARSPDASTFNLGLGWRAGIKLAALLLFVPFATLSHAQPGLGAAIVINEIDYDQPGSDTAEFIELLNVSGETQNLADFSIELINGNGGAVYDTIALGAGTLADGEYFVICADTANVANCDLEGFSSVQNGGPDAVALMSGTDIVDTVSYEGDTVAPYTEGSGVGLLDDSSGGAGGVNEFKSISRQPNGADTDVNNIDFSFVCMSPGEVNLTTTSNCQPAELIEIVINEIDYQEQGITDTEFVELYNSGNTNIDLSGYSLELIDGDTATAYQTISLPSISLAPGDYFVVCGTASVSSCDLNSALGNDFIQNGSPDAVALLEGTTVVDTVSYDGSVAAPYTEGNGTGLIDTATEASAGIGRFPDGNDSDQNNSDFSVRCSTPGSANTTITTSCTGGTAIEIFTIQGNGLSSSLVGQIVTTEDNIVTGVGADGFFMQTPTARSDGDSDTSDGIWVFTFTAPTVSVGDQVDVTGEIEEFFELTEFTNGPLITIDSSGNALPAPVVLDANVPSPLQPQSAIELERYEGMVVSFMGIATGPTDRFGDTPVTAQLERAYREPGIEFPGLTGLPVWDGNPEVIEIDVDALSLADQAIFGGQTVTAEGPLGFAFGDYQVWPTSFSAGTPPTLPRPVRAKNAGEFTIATQNFFRIFDDVDDPGVDDEVVPLAEYLIRLEKASYQIIENLGAPDVVALQEVEGTNMLQALAARIASDQPGLNYDVHVLQGNDVGGINVAYLTRQDTISVSNVEQFGADLILAFDGSLLNDRPPLVLEASYIGGGDSFDFTVINVHQRSLGGIDGNEATRVKTKRLEQAQVLAQYIQDLQTASPDIRLVVTGDFNAFEFTDGYVDVMGQISGLLDPLGDEFATTDIVNPDLTNQVLSLPAEERYSFVFSGSAQTLDHTLTSQALNSSVSGFEFARANADVPSSLLLLTGAGTPPIADNTALRSSDHDGGVLYILTATDSDQDGVADSVDNCTLVANTDQRDTNGDGFGNICDPDLNNDGVVNFLDVQVFASLFGTANNGDADLNGDGFINFLDYSIVPGFFLMPPGPSGIAP